MIAGTTELTDFEWDWAENEPSTTPGNDYCAYMDKTAGFKWKAGLCLSGKPFLCSARAPNCPAGYTWLPNIGPKCFKITDRIAFTDSSNNIFVSEAKANKICESQGTRLATLMTNDDKTAFWNWLSSNGANPSVAPNYYYLGMRYHGGDGLYTVNN